MMRIPPIVLALASLSTNLFAKQTLASRRDDAKRRNALPSGADTMKTYADAKTHARKLVTLHGDKVLARLAQQAIVDHWFDCVSGLLRGRDEEELGSVSRQTLANFRDARDAAAMVLGAIDCCKAPEIRTFAV